MWGKKKQVSTYQQRVAQRKKQAERERKAAQRARWKNVPPVLGWPNRWGGAMANLVDVPRWRGTTFQVCGLWPFSAGTGAPLQGVPVGQTVDGSTVCCDPITWFETARLISNPSEFVLGNPGLGKSTFIRRQCLGLAAFGTLPLVFGDTKPDYVDLIEALGGQVISLGTGRDFLNPLDVGNVGEVAARIDPKAGKNLINEARSRRLQMLLALIQIVRGRQGKVSDREEALLAAALDVWDEAEPGHTPLVSDIVRVIDSHPDACDQMVLTRGDIEAYRAIADKVSASLLALGSRRWGGLFGEHTTTPMRLDRPVVFDVSDLDRQSEDVMGAVLLTCWSYGFAQVNIAQALQDAGLARPQHYFIVMDELWRILSAGVGMVDRINELTRLNRQRGVGQAMCTHTLNDLEALPSEEDRRKARGFVARSGLVVTGGLADDEAEALSKVLPLSGKERATITAWTNPESWNAGEGLENLAPPGQGKFLIKVGQRPGIPLTVRLTEAELMLNDTNKRWANSRVGRHARGSN